MGLLRVVGLFDLYQLVVCLSIFVGLLKSQTYKHVSACVLMDGVVNWMQGGSRFLDENFSETVDRES